MKILTQKELDDLYFVQSQDKGGVQKTLDTLEVNQSLHVTRDDWEGKSPINNRVSNWFSKTGKKFKTRTLKNDKGCVITRII